MRINTKTIVLGALIIGVVLFFTITRIKHISKSKLFQQERAEARNSVNVFCSEVYLGGIYEVEVTFIPYSIKTYSNIAPEHFNDAYWAKVSLNSRKDKAEVVDLCKQLSDIKNIGPEISATMDTRWAIYIYKNKAIVIRLYGTGGKNGRVGVFEAELPKGMNTWVAKQFSDKDVYSLRNIRFSVK